MYARHYERTLNCIVSVNKNMHYFYDLRFTVSGI